MTPIKIPAVALLKEPVRAASAVAVGDDAAVVAVAAVAVVAECLSEMSFVATMYPAFLTILMNPLAGIVVEEVAAAAVVVAAAVVIAVNAQVRTYR